MEEDIIEKRIKEFDELDVNFSMSIDSNTLIEKEVIDRSLKVYELCKELDLTAEVVPGYNELTVSFDNGKDNFLDVTVSKNKFDIEYEKVVDDKVIREYIGEYEEFLDVFYNLQLFKYVT